MQSLSVKDKGGREVATWKAVDGRAEGGKRSAVPTTGAFLVGIQITECTYPRSGWRRW